MKDVLTYTAVLITMASGLFAFFWERDGQRRNVRGISWIAAALIVAGGAIALFQINHAARTKADAESRSEALETMLMRTTLGGFDFTKPFERGNFSIEAPAQADALASTSGPLVGAFPLLPSGGSGTIRIGMQGAFYHEFRLSPVGRGVRLDNANRRDPSFLVNATSAGIRVTQAGSSQPLEGQGQEGVLPNFWGAQPTDDSVSYYLNLAPISTLDALVRALSTARRYGSIEVSLPGRAAAERQRLIAAYSALRPSFVFYAPLAGTTAQTDDCVSYIRVPMRIQPRQAATPEAVAFDLVVTTEGIQTEVCAGAQ